MYSLLSYQSPIGVAECRNQTAKKLRDLCRYVSGEIINDNVRYSLYMVK
jgi:hypothetical protein